MLFSWIRSNGRWRWLLSLLLAILIAVISLNTALPVYYHNKLMKDFKPYPYERSYLDAVPLHEMDIQNIKSRLNYIVAVAEMKPADMTVTLPRDIRYYIESEGKKELVLKLDKGTSVQWTFEENWVDYGYGYLSFPTYDKEWRYVRPFLPAGGIREQADIAEYYYVKLSDLEAVLKAIRNDSFIFAARAQGITKSSLRYYILRDIDRQLYELGLYCSPDLTRPLYPKIH